MSAVIAALVVLVLLVAVILVVLAITALRDGRRHDQETLALVIGSRDREVDQYRRALISRHAPEFAMLERSAQAVDLVEAQANFARTLDPRLDEYVDDETGERMVPVGLE